ncbi:MAG: invasion associated locus B family protein [Beijerinckiaceae bacterium]
MLRFGKAYLTVVVALFGMTGQGVAQDWLSPRPSVPAPQQQQRPPQQQQQRPAAQQQQQRPPAPQQAQQQQPAQQQPAQQQAQPVSPDLIQVFNDWRISCVPRPNRACQITQRQVNPTNQSQILLAELTVVSQPKPRTILSMVVPLGVKLGQPLSLRNESGEVASLPLVTCTNAGCIHSGDISPKAVEMMRKAKSMNTTVADLRGQSAPLRLSVNGFEDAYQRVAAYLKGS